MENKEIENQRNSALKKTLVGIYFVALISYVVVDLIYSDFLYQKSLELTIYLRKGSTEGFTHYYNQVLARPFYDWIHALPFLLLLSLGNKAKALKYCLIYYFNFSVKNGLMAVYRDPRPCWKINDPKITCKCGYGKPSGHAMITTVAYGILLYELILIKKTLSKAKKYLFTMIYGYIIFSIMWGRLYLAAHTFSHVIIGHFLGGFILLVSLLYETKLDDICLKILQEKSSALMAFVWSLSFSLLVTGVWVVEHFSHQKEQEYHDNPYIKGRCIKCFNGGMDSFGYRIIYSLSATTFLPGIFLALTMKNKPHVPNLNYGKQFSKCFTIFRILIMGLFLIPGLLLSKVGFYKSVKMKVVGSYVTSFIGCFLMIYISFDLFAALGIYYEGDLVNISYAAINSEEMDLDEEILNSSFSHSTEDILIIEDNFDNNS